MQNTNKVNKLLTKKILHQHRFKKFNPLKYKPKSTIKTNIIEANNKIHERSKSMKKATFGKILRATNNTTTNRTSRANINKYENKDTHGKFWSLNQANGKYKQGNKPLKKTQLAV